MSIYLEQKKVPETLRELILMYKYTVHCVLLSTLMSHLLKKFLILVLPNLFATLLYDASHFGALLHYAMFCAKRDLQSSSTLSNNCFYINI